MSEIKKVYYKYCIVPKCTNTTSTTPNKFFFLVPFHVDKRKQWCEVMKRDIMVGPKSTLYVCEDHFDIENDVENLLKYRLVGGTLKLKPTVIPHKFNCQEVEKPPTSGRRKKLRTENMEVPLENSVTKSPSQPFEVIYCNSVIKTEQLDIDIKEDPLPEDYDMSIPNNSPPTKKQKPLQGDIIIKQEEDDNMTNNHTDTIGVLQDNSLSEMSASPSSQNSVIPTYNRTTKPLYCTDTITKIYTNINFYLGLPEDIYFLTNMLSESISSTVKDILISLKKIRLNDSYERLAIDFDICKGSVTKILNNVIPLIAHCMKQLILFPPIEQIYEKLPIPLRKRYFKTVSILDYFEIEIEKPSSPLQQSLTWSDNKQCNTIKYVISITPDGLISFISDGYGGKTSDAVILEDCDFLEKLTPGCSVIANRGFENSSHLLEAKGCHLVSPPSLTVGKPSSKLKAMEAKRIVAECANIKRTIDRLRDFSMVAPNSCIETRLIYLLDSIVVTACGMVNLKNKLIKV